MQGNSNSASFGQIAVILRGEPEPINNWIQQWNAGRALLYVAVIVLGTGLYGAAIGSWRDPQQALYTAFKFPLIILLTTFGNGLLNGMLAPLLGLDASFRQSLQAMLMSFMIVGAILGAFSPVVWFMVWNAPVMTASHSLKPSPSTDGWYELLMVMDVVIVGFAGMAGNLRLAQLLRRLSGSAAAGQRVLFAWLAGNFLLGSQLAWILRPFIGAPNMPVEFLRKNAFDGNFYETLFQSLKHLIFS